ncbi:MAG: MarR family winged helix-turn-helix transcriptional regulator, partial [Fimbriimonadaceae bacterium]|nr:MarR family winged helix-turn-helix transcriptional regulator [Alphaproteobacteria bacterium]
IGVTPGEFSLLALVSENPGIHQISLVRVYKLDKSTLSNSIKDLKNRKLIRQIRDRNDRRYYGLWLTEFGEAVLARATVRVEAQEHRMDSVLLPGEREQLLEQLSRISRAFD